MSLLIEKLIDKIIIEESEYIRNSELNKLSSTQIHYLDLINHEPDSTASLLAKKLKVTKPSATGHLEKLEKLGYIRRVRSEEDGRVQFLELTKTGKEIAEKHDRFHEIFTRKFTESLDFKETASLGDILKKALD